MHKESLDVVAFFPTTGGNWLANGVKKIMREEGERIGFKIKVVERSGTPLASLFSHSDLSGYLYLTAGWRAWGHHTRDQAQTTRGPALFVTNGTEKRLGSTHMQE